MLLIAKNWWSLALRGIVAILLGLLTFALPGITLNVLVLLFGAYALVDGILNLAGAWRHSRMHERWGALLIEGLAGTIAGVVTFAWPAITVFFLVMLIAVWAIITGILEVAAAIRLRKHIRGEWLLALSGVASVLFGVLLIVAPLAGALVIALWFGVYAVIFGVLLIAVSLRLRSWSKSTGLPVSTIPPTR